MNSWFLVAALVAQVTPAQEPAPVAARPGNLAIHGEMSALVAGYPKQHGTRELRARGSLNMTADPRPWLHLRLEGLAEVLVADRAGSVTRGIVAVREAWAELRLNHLEVRAGHGRIVWGRLDEIMPSDVINPIDTARFFLDGRADARLPVTFVRTRVFLPAEASVEAVVSLPGRRGRFDSLDEATSPFNLLKDTVLPAGFPGDLRIRRERLPASWRNLQGGLRLSATAGQVDMSVSAWRGFEGFGLASFDPFAFPAELVERYPRFTMIAGDAEMVRGGWAIRGEVAAFLDKTMSGPLGPTKGRAVDAGVGVDRSAGDYHLFGSLVWHREWFTSVWSSVRQHLNVIASVDRRFSRERYLARLFGVFNPDDRSGFVRGLASWSVRDNVLLEASGGAFLGEGMDTIGRFTDRDFAFLRVKYSF